MSEHQEVRVERDGDIATIVLDRPERRNALSADLGKRLRAAIDDVSERVLILTGCDGAFCAGGDLDELQSWADMPAERIGEELYAGFQGLIRSIRASDAIVIAAINGAAVGAGMDLALACDLRIAARTARLGQVWVRLGLIPGTGGAWLAPALAGWGKAAELLLTGDLISAEEALEAGLVNAVAEPESLLDDTRALAAKILRHPRDGVIANKRALVAASEPNLEAALVHAAKVQPARFKSEEFHRAVRSSRS